MYASKKSDESVVPTTSANNGATDAPAERIEERDSAKRNVAQSVLHRMSSRVKRKSRGLHGVREAARKESTLTFTALLHHVNEDSLREAFFNLKKSAAVGIDGVTWQDYEQNLEVNVVAVGGRGHACNTWRDVLFPVHTLFTHNRTNDFAPDSRQEPYEVILHVRNCAGDCQQRQFLPR